MDLDIPVKTAFMCIAALNIDGYTMVFYIYGRFWSLSTNGHKKNGLYNIFYGRLENTNKFSNVWIIKM